MADGISAFNGDISKWDSSNAIDMSGVFHGDISKWDVPSVMGMSEIFSVVK